MNRARQVWLQIAFAASFLAVGIPYWLIPYNTINLPDALLKPGLFVVVLAALLLRSCAVARFWKVVGMVGVSVPAAVFARVIVDGLNDPSSHDLWPLEIIIALLLGFFSALAGAIVGGVGAKLVARRPGRR